MLTIYNMYTGPIYGDQNLSFNNITAFLVFTALSDNTYHVEYDKNPGNRIPPQEDTQPDAGK